MTHSSDRMARPHRVYFAIEAWWVGALTAVIVWVSALPDYGWRLPEGHFALALLVVGVSTALTAVVVSPRRAGALEVGAVLALAHVPLALARLSAWHLTERHAPAEPERW